MARSTQPSCLLRAAVAGALLTTVMAAPVLAQERVVKIYGFGAKSGVVRIFGLNS